MFGLSNMGPSGLILILIMVLIVFGPKRLPGIGKALGKSLREFRDATSNIINTDEPAEHTTAHDAEHPHHAEQMMKSTTIQPMPIDHTEAHTESQLKHLD